MEFSAKPLLRNPLSARRQAPPEPTGEPDPADLGTAFGLDASLLPDAPPDPTGHEDAAASPAPPNGWLRPR